MTPTSSNPKGPAKSETKVETKTAKPDPKPAAEEEEPREGTPKLETPESGPEVVPEDAPRDEQAPLEVRAETPVVRTPMGTKAPKSTPLTAVTPDVAALFTHVADNAVDSHAPVWTSRPSNVTGANTSGGYS